MPKKATASSTIQPAPPPSRELKINHSKGTSKWSSMRILTPIGIAAWPWLNSPKTTFSADGVYEVEVIVTPDEAAALESDLRALAAAYSEHHNPGPVPVLVPVKPHVVRGPDGADVDTGKFSIKCRLHAMQKKGDGPPVAQRPKVVDAKTNPIVPVPRVGAGTKLRVACDAIARVVVKENIDPAGKVTKIPVMYVSLTMAVVQIVDLVLFDGGSPEQYGMDELEGYDFSAPEGGLDGGPQVGAGEVPNY